MANIEYLQTMINRFLGNEKSEFLLEGKAPETNEAAIGRLVSGCVSSPADISFGQDIKSAMSSCGQIHDECSLAVAV